MKHTRDQLGPAQFKVLGRIVGNMFEQGERLEPLIGPRGGIKHYELKPSHQILSRSIIDGMMRSGLISDDLSPTPAGTNLYLRSLIERPA